MFEIFEPLIRHNCGKLFILAAIGAISITVMSYQVITTACHMIAHVM